MMILSELKLFALIYCWLYFVPLCSGSGDEALSLYKCQQAEKIKPKFFEIM